MSVEARLTKFVALAAAPLLLVWSVAMAVGALFVWPNEKVTPARMLAVK
jgi:hypothetical protein